MPPTIQTYGRVAKHDGYWLSLGLPQNVSVAPPAEPRGEKKLFFVEILGGEKLLKLVEKCR